MPIYPDKKGEKLTGRWRVEIQKDGRRYRQRHDDHAAAKADEKRVLAAWAQGLEVDGPVAVRKDPHAPTIGNVMKLAKGKLWRGQAHETIAWIHLDLMAGIIGRETLLEDVQTRHVDEIVSALLKGTEDKKPVTESTVNRYLSHLHTFMDWAKARGHRKTAVSEVTFDWQEENEGRIRWITPDEEFVLMTLLPRDVGRLVKVAIETGCRRGELLNVEPSQINGNRLHLWETKTKTPRTVPMDPEITQILKRLVATNAMPSESELRYAWEKAKAAMGLQDDGDFVFHCTRHTCATRLVEAGVNLRVIQRFLGHKRIETTMRYAHVHDDMLEDAVTRRKRHQDQTSLSGPWGNMQAATVGLQAA